MIRFGQHIMDLCQPKVMGILNVTPDSFAVHCARLDEASVAEACEQLLEQGADLIDVGACSTRPGGELVDEQQERARLDMALRVVRRLYPEAIVSVDTFRASIARFAIEQYGADMINDVSGLSDEGMVDVVARARVPYIITHAQGLDASFLSFFAQRLDWLHEAGVSDVVVDPGIGFGKSLEENYAVLHRLPLLRQLGAPVLVGLSRKSMIYQPLHLTPQEALNGTTAAHMLALMGGANILRVHDVKEAKQTITIWNNYSQSSPLGM